MKDNQRGPFVRIRWFCKDGILLPPEPYACKDHGGGSQHGEWSDQTRALRDQGYRIANIYADLDVDHFLTQPDWYDDLAQILVEQFLIKADDGWILRKARYYRGAFQEEGERSGARRLLLALLRDNTRLEKRFLQLRTAAALLSHGRDTASIQTVRQLAVTLSEKDPGFIESRNKIHARPDANDAQRVRNYARRVENEVLRMELEDLAERIEAVYNIALAQELERLQIKFALPGGLSEAITRTRQYLNPQAEPEAQFRATAELLAAIRNNIGLAGNEYQRLELLDLSLLIEAEHFAAASALAASVPELTRRELLELLNSGLTALYGSGLISSRQLAAAVESLKTMDTDSVSLVHYKRELNYLSLVPEWGVHTGSLYFSRGINILAEIEPDSRLFIQDLVRSSPLFFYARFIDTLLLDAYQLAGIQNRLFDKNAGAGLRALNPGLARGVLHIAAPGDGGAFERDGIYLLPETVADLPPIAGILTAGEGNPLSHVQLLARNLGIPNVTIDQRLIEELKPHAGKHIMLAVSPGGTVQLSLMPELEETPAPEGENRLLIEPDLDKLDLVSRDLVPLSQLRAADSGRIAGPKSAKLGELKYRFPEAVAGGLVIPFGVFRDHLRQKFPGSNQTMFEWMVANYRTLEKLPAGSAERMQNTEQFRQRLEAWLLGADLDKNFIDELRNKMERQFGKDGGYGVFLRSDTNVEDLPGFTGAGLNLTVPNVIGFENIIPALKRVWASPFSARAFAWRQAWMRQPEHVYSAVLLMLSVDVEKSGVLVTQDIDTGGRDWLSVAVNEGIGGAVDGQGAESLRINMDSGAVRLMAQASAPVRRQLNPDGGLLALPAHLDDAVLRPEEIAQLITLVRGLPQRFPPIENSSGQTLAADIEFGFLKGQLRLFQIRPYLENQSARQNEFLRSLDMGETLSESIIVDLNAIPEA